MDSYSGAPSPLLIRIFVWLLLTESFIHADENDVDCLKAIKSSFQDPNNQLASWIFDNNTQSSICEFTGVECWPGQEDAMVLNIRLSDMGLKGEFPLGISGCKSMTGLDLSSNNIHGTIPNNISRLIGFITTLDLSSNQFSGEIPVDLAKCTFLNFLKLDNNQLTGQIPPRIGLLDRIQTFTVTKNQLTGPIPVFINSSIPADSYAGNPGLCGKPLPDCPSPSAKSHSAAIVGAPVGGVTFVAVVFYIGLFFHLRGKKK